MKKGQLSTSQGERPGTGVPSQPSEGNTPAHTLILDLQHYCPIRAYCPSHTACGTLLWKPPETEAPFHLLSGSGTLRGTDSKALVPWELTSCWLHP